MAYLSLEERELLISAYEAPGKIIKLHKTLAGSHVQVNGKNFSDDKNPVYARKYVAALDSLLIKGLIDRDSKIQFSLTPEGERTVLNLLKEPS